MATNYRATRVEQLQKDHPALRPLVEKRLRQRRLTREIADEIRKRFGVKIAATSVWRFWTLRLQPQEEAEVLEFRRSLGLAAAILQEMKADPTLDATKIAEVLLAAQLVKDRVKLADVDIMQLYRQQREFKKIELQGQPLQQKGKKAKKNEDAAQEARARHKPFDRHEAFKQISAVIGVGAELRERVEPESAGDADEKNKR